MSKAYPPRIEQKTGTYEGWTIQAKQVVICAGGKVVKSKPLSGSQAFRRAGHIANLNQMERKSETYWTNGSKSVQVIDLLLNGDE